MAWVALRAAAGWQRAKGALRRAAAAFRHRRRRGGGGGASGRPEAQGLLGGRGAHDYEAVAEGEDNGERTGDSEDEEREVDEARSVMTPDPVQGSAIVAGGLALLRSGSLDALTPSAAPSAIGGIPTAEEAAAAAAAAAPPPKPSYSGGLLPSLFRRTSAKGNDAALGPAAGAHHAVTLPSSAQHLPVPQAMVLSWENITVRVRLPRGRMRYVLQSVSGISGPQQVQPAAAATGASSPPPPPGASASAAQQQQQQQDGSNRSTSSVANSSTGAKQHTAFAGWPGFNAPSAEQPAAGGTGTGTAADGAIEWGDPGSEARSGTVQPLSMAPPNPRHVPYGAAGDGGSARGGFLSRLGLAGSPSGVVKGRWGFGGGAVAADSGAARQGSVDGHLAAAARGVSRCCLFAIVGPSGAGALQYPVTVAAWGVYRTGLCHVRVSTKQRGARVWFMQFCRGSAFCPTYAAGSPCRPQARPR